MAEGYLGTCNITHARVAVMMSALYNGLDQHDENFLRLGGHCMMNIVVGDLVMFVMTWGLYSL